MKRKSATLSKLYLRKVGLIADKDSSYFAERIGQAPKLIFLGSVILGNILERNRIIDKIISRLPITGQFVNFLYGNIALVQLSKGNANSQMFDSESEEFSTESDFDIIVIGSGPGGSIAALRSLQKGARVLMIESGRCIKPGLVEHHSLVQTKWQFKNAGLNFIWGLKPVLFAEGETLGGGSEVNSGLYHRLQGTHRENILRSLQVGENEWAELEKLVESELSIQLDPESVEPDHGLVLGARRLGLEAEEVPRWRKYIPSIEHQSMQITYLHQARNLGLKVMSNTQAIRLLLTKERVEVIAKSATQNEVRLFAKEVVLAAGALGTPQILNNSKISNKSFKLNFHPMLRGVGQQTSVINHGDLFPSWQVWTDDLRLKYGYSVSTFPYLAATLQSMGERSNYNEVELSRMAAYFGSFTIKDSRVVLAKLGSLLVPIISWGKIDKRTMYEVKAGLKALLIAGGATKTWPRNNSSAVTTVHLFGSIPIGNQDLVDSFGKLKCDSRIRISDASLMPHAPWGNPQGPIMVMCELLAKRV
jgi:hypothetical protein